MKKVVLYGVRHVELRRDVEYFLGNDCKIVGYSDTYYKNDVLDGKRFIPPDQLTNEEFDYVILLSFKESILESMRANLMLLGIPSQKIVRPTMFLNKGMEKMQLDLIADIEAQYHGESGLIFGLSYSLRGIFEKKLRPVFYDCSWHGIDLYYNFQIFQYMRKRCLLSNVKIAFMVFPYDVFNYDMSRSLYQYRTGQIFSLRGLNDYHNYQQTPGALEYVINYQLFSKKISDFYRMRRYEQQNQGVYSGPDGKGALKGPWVRHYPETIVENTALFDSFCCALRDIGISLVMIVPPYYLKGFDRASLGAADRMKREYYQIIGAQGLKVFDFFDIYADCREFFVDLIHLNSYGAKAFTELINQTVLQG